MENKFVDKIVKQAAEKTGIDISGYDIGEIKMGMSVEMEHGSELGDDTNISDDDPITTLKIVLAHLKEIPDYYIRLAKMEKEGKKERGEVSNEEEPEENDEEGTLKTESTRMRELIGETENRNKKQLKSEYFSEEKNLINKAADLENFDVYEFDKKAIEPKDDDNSLYSME